MKKPPNYNIGQFCRECQKLVFPKDAFGTDKAFCSLECWFNWTAREYTQVCAALGFDAFPEQGPIAEPNTADITSLLEQADRFLANADGVEWCDACEALHVGQCQP